jgi:hypothetical protein
LQRVAGRCGLDAGARGGVVHWHLTQSPRRRSSDASLPAGAGVTVTQRLTPRGGGAEAPAEVAGGLPELHVHVDREDDGHMSVVISDFDMTHEEAEDERPAAADDEVAPGDTDTAAAGTPSTAAAHGATRFGSSMRFGSGARFGSAARFGSQGQRPLGAGLTPPGAADTAPAAARVPPPLPPPPPPLRVLLSEDRRRSSEVAASECDTTSDLSALASPFAYAERVRGRLEQHLPPRRGRSGGSGGASGSGFGAAGGAVAALAAPGTPVTADAAAEQLDRFLDGHATLKQRAGECHRAAHGGGR